MISKLDEFLNFITERWNIHEARRKGLPSPWTKDPVLATYRFTNIRREDDRVTRWVHQNWLRPNAGDPDVWFAMYVARVFNNPETLDLIGYPTPWNSKRANKTYRACEAIKYGDGKIFNGAYIVSTHRQACNSKHEFYIGIFNRLWNERTVIRPRPGDRLETFYERLKQQNGLGSFMTAQVVADVKHVMPLKRVRDWWTFAHSGPGSRRGLNWVYGRDPKAPWKEDEWVAKLLQLKREVDKLPGIPKLDAQNVQNLNCEFSKYCKVKFAGGRAKQLFKPSQEPYGAALPLQTSSSVTRRKEKE